MIIAANRGEACPSGAGVEGRGATRSRDRAAGGPYGLDSREPVESVRLRCGVDVTIRAIRPDDLEMARAFARGLSKEACYQRLLSNRRLLPGELERLIDIDYDQRMALTAIASLDGLSRMLGIARYVKDSDRDDCAEAAIVVTDSWQRCGLGEALLRRLMVAGKDRGIRQLKGITLSRNTAMRELARKLGFSVRLDAGDGTVTQLAKTL